MTRGRSMMMPPLHDDASVSSERWLGYVSAKMQPRERVTLDCGATVQHFSHGDWALDDAPPCDDHLFAFRTSGTVQAERKLDAKWRSAATRRASITMVPARHPSSWRLRGSGTVLHVYIPPSLLRRVAGESLPPGDEYAVSQHLGAFDDRLRELSERLEQEIERQELGFTLYTEAIITQLTISLLRDHSSARLPRMSEGRRFRGRTEKRIVEYIEENRKTKITLSQLAGLAGLGLSQLNLNFRATFGVPAYEYVTRSRIEYAKRLLANSDLPVATIALEAGFAHQPHLTRTFRRLCGTTPAAYRARSAR